MIEPRIYRAAFLPALFALVVAMFSLESRPAPLPQGLAADVLFEGRLAANTMRNIAETQPDRRPGTIGNAAVANLVTEQFRNRGYDPVVRERFTANGQRLENVMARKPGAEPEQIVLAAARDTEGRGPDATGSAADTAALLELARVFEGRSARATIVLASIDGSSVGDAGARRLYRSVRRQGPVRAIVIMSNLGAGTSRGPLVVPWSNDGTRGSIALERTAASSLRQELGGLPEDEGPIGQLARLAFPIGVGPQGVLLEEDAPVVRISGSGELPPERRAVGDANVERMGSLGRAVLRTASALDRPRELRHGPASYVIVARSVMPGWALGLLSLVLLLPPLVASVDAAARARRRKERIARWWLWVLAAALPFVIGLVVAEFLALVGQAPKAPPAAEPPSAAPLDGAALVSLLVVAAAVVIAWLLARPLFARRAGAPGDPQRPGAGAATALALSAVVLVLWFVNPVAALVLVPAVHLWMLAMVADTRPAVSGVLVALGLVGPAGVALYYMARLSLDPLEGAWYLFLLVTGHQVGLFTALMGCALLGLLGSTLAVVLARRRREEPEPPRGPRLRGPSGYAGPGSLGGTESAIRR